MDDESVYVREAVAVGMTAQEQGVARIAAARDELARIAARRIERARRMSRALEEAGVIEAMPELEEG